MLRIGTIVLNVKDAQRAAQFWHQALGYAYQGGGYREDATPVLLPQSAAAVAIALDESDRTHLDLTPTTSKNSRPKWNAWSSGLRLRGPDRGRGSVRPG